MVKTVVLLLVTAVLLSVACEESREDNLARRLDAFRSVLPDGARAAFDAGEDSLAATIIDSEYVVDRDFARAYDSLKHDELIDVFTHRDVVDFFRTYFVEELANARVGSL
jgi:hypothetical protein